MTTALAFLRDKLFSEKLMHENRNLTLLDPAGGYFVFVFSLDDAIGFGGRYGLAPPEPRFWLQLVAVVLLESILNVAVAAIIYKLIVQKQGSASSFLVGYGFVCPLLACTPFYLSRLLDLRNTAIIIGCASAPSLLFFRCLEAMHGTTPKYALKKPQRYALYFAATVQFEFDPDTEEAVPMTRQHLRRKATNVVRLFAATSLLYSLLMPYGYSAFPRREVERPADLFFWGNIVNNALLAYLTSVCLEVGSDGIGLAISLLSGINTVQLNYSPMTASSSPSDFWGNRWNVLISSALKRGVFVPCRKAGFARPVAALLTFVASGLLHEYLTALMIIQASRNSGDGMTYRYPPQILGKHLIFFVWNAVVLILEVPLKDTKPIRWISWNVPAFIRTCLVIMAVLPIAHLFTDVYVDIGFYSDFSVGFPLIVRIYDS